MPKLTPRLMIFVLLLSLLLAACSANTPAPSPNADAVQTAIALTEVSANIAKTLEAMPTRTPHPTSTPTLPPQDIVIEMPKPNGFNCANISNDWALSDAVTFALGDLVLEFTFQSDLIYGKATYQGEIVAEFTSSTTVPGNANIWQVTRGFDNVAHDGRVDNVSLTLYIPVCGEKLYANGWQPAWPITP